jgi:hypothetical protein
MQTLDTITNDAFQRHSIIIDNGQNRQQVQLDLRYNPTQAGWYADITTTGFSLTGVRLCTHINLLRQFKRVIAFGLQISCDNNYEPFDINDFLTGRATLSFLNAAEVAEIEELLKNA